MSSEREVDRIRDVYAYYDRTPAEQRKRDGHNPGNRAMALERQRRLEAALAGYFADPREQVRCLDVGCGRGEWLGWLAGLGFAEDRMTGVDLLPGRIEEARERYPRMRFECLNAEELPFPDAAFDLVVSATVFSSVLDAGMARALAGSMQRVLAPGGAVLWYDFRYRSPSNPNVRPIGRAELRSLFPNLRPRLESMTLLPPLARRVGGLAGAYPLLASLPPLRSHLGGLLLRAS